VSFKPSCGAAFIFMAWDPAQYEKFKAERARPFFDLLAQLDDISPKTIVDLGCGTGELTAELGYKWPQARVLGLDSSPEMIANSAPYASKRLRFEISEIESWSPTQPVDLVFSNAAFHWLKNHEQQIKRLAGFVAPEGALAFQAPNQFREPSHTIIQEVRNATEWKPLIGSEQSDGYLAQPHWYLETFRKLGFEPRLWETIYYQVLQGDDAALEWVKGTALRGVLAKLNGEQQQRFLAQCGEKFRKAYPKENGGTLFPYRRMFVVAKRR
jgi:trans-aconitate 2-methyltransferase